VERYDRLNKTRRPVTITNQTDISFAGIIWDETSNSFIADADHTGFHYLYSINMFPNVAIPPDNGKNVAVLSSIAKLGGSSSSLVKLTGKNQFIFQWNSMKSPTDLYSFSYSWNSAAGTGSAGTPKQITMANADILSGIQMQDPQQVTFAGAGGDTVYMWVIPPYNAQPGKTYPVANIVHGGPEGSWLDDWSYRWNPQLWTGHGYGVLLIDFHGSTGYGQNFTNSILGHWGDLPYSDVMTGLNVALNQFDWMDPKRVVACGASYGGYMINWIQGHTTQYKALVTHDGMFDTFSSYFTTDELWFPEAEFLGTPWQNPSVYHKWNPMMFVDKWQTPHLVIHGQHDYRLTLGNGLSVFTALQRRGIPSKLLYFTMENHWVLNDENGIKWYHTVLGWIDKYAK